MKNKLNLLFQTGIAISPRPTAFGPVLYSGRMEQGLQALSQAGFDYAELSLRTTGDLDPVRLRELLQELDLQISAIATGQACLFDSLCLCSPDSAQRRQAVDHFKNMILFAKDLEIPRVIIGGIRGRLAGTPDQQMLQYDLGVDSIRQCAHWADDNGIMLLIEPINRYEANWILTASEGMDILKEIDVPSTKLLLDTFHMNIEESSMKSALIQTGEKLGYVHLADNTRCAPGQGQTNFREILETLKEIGFDGPLVSEILPLPDDATAVQQTAQFWESINTES